MMKFIRYTEGYRFQLEEDHAHPTGITPQHAGGNRFVRLNETGLLTISAGYAWDGASGPAINTASFMRASLVHDVLYQLIRLGVITLADRARADELLRDIALQDGMWPVRAWWVFHAVRIFGERYMQARPDTVLTAP